MQLRRSEIKQCSYVRRSGPLLHFSLIHTTARVASHKMQSPPATYRAKIRCNRALIWSVTYPFWRQAQIFSDPSDEMRMIYGWFMRGKFGFCTHQVCGVLEGVVEVGDPPPVPEHKNVPLLLEARCLCPLQHLPLVQDLQGEHLVRVLHLDHAYLPERSPPDHFQDLKVFFAQP